MNPNSSTALRFGQRAALSGQPGEDLESLDTTPLPDGCEVVVNAAPTDPDIFILVKTDETTVPDGTNVIAPTSGAGRWFRYSFLAGSGVASVTGTAPIASSGGVNPDISISPATILAAGSRSPIAARRSWNVSNAAPFALLLTISTPSSPATRTLPPFR